MPRSVIVVLVSIALALVVWLIAGDRLFGGGGDGSRPITATDAATETGAVTAARADGDDAPGASTATERRETVASPPPALPDDRQSLLGVLRDAEGAAVVDAEVTVEPSISWAPEDGEAAAWFDFGDRDAALAARRSMLERATRARTAADGGFRVPVPAAARSVTIRVRARGFVGASRDDLRLPAEGDVDTGVWSLERGAILGGRVVDHARRPVADARVVHAEGEMPDHWQMPPGDFDDVLALDLPFQVTRTDSDGRFEFAHIAASACRLTASHPDHPPTVLAELSVAPGSVRDDLELVLAVGATIAGRVVDAERATRELRVVAADASVPSDSFPSFGGPAGERHAEVEADGSFELRGLRANTVYRLAASEVTSVMMEWRSASPTIDALAGTRDVVLAYDPGATVRVRVVDAVTSAPMPKVEIGVLPAGFADHPAIWRAALVGRETDAGIVEYAGIAPTEGGTMVLSIRAAGYAEARRDGITLPLRGVVDIGTVPLEPVPTLVVTVLAADGATPVDGASVSIHDAEPDPDAAEPWFMTVFGQDGLRTGTDGQVALNLRPGARLRVKVQHTDHATWLSEPLLAPSRGSLEHRAVLCRGGSLEITATEADGTTPAGGAVIAWVAPDGPRLGRATDAAGRTVFDRLAPGVHRFRIGAGDGDSPFGMLALVHGGGGREAGDGWETVEVVDGARSALRLAREPSAAVTGTVRENGVPLAGAGLWFRRVATEPTDAGEAPQPWDFLNAELRQRHLQCGDDGTFRVEQLEPGEYELRVSHDTRRMDGRQRVHLSVGANTVDVDLDVAIVRGVVRDPDGRPLAGARVDVRRAGEDGPSMVLGAAALGLSSVDMDFAGIGEAGRGTGDDGSFELRGVTADTDIVIEASHEKYVAATSPTLTVTPGGTVDGLVLTVARGGSLRVTLPADLTQGFVTISLQDDERASRSGAIGADRSAGFDGLAPGRWTVFLHSDVRSFPPQEVEIRVGETTRVAF